METGFNNARTLVIGGAGFVGSNLVRMLLAADPTTTVTVIDNLLSSERENLPADFRLRFIQGSISEDRTLKRVKDEYDYIFHLATFHGNQSSIHDPLRDHDNNTLTTLKLFERIKGFKRLRKVVYSSAGCSVAKKTFGDAEATTEESPIEVRQDSPYSISKIVGEFYSVYYNKQHGLPVVRARFQNVYGPGEVLGAGEWRGTYATVWRNVTPTFIYKAIKGLPIPLENEGVASRDFIFVEDICSGLIACALKGEAGDVYNLGSGKETTIRELAETINRLAGGKSSVELLPRRPWDNSGHRFASTAKSERQLGFKAEIGIEEGLKRTMEWTFANMPRIEKCIHKHDSNMEKLKKM